MEYQLPRLIKMWTHLERQAGGKSRGMGEKQIEVDRRLLRSRIAQLRNKLDEVSMYIALYTFFLQVRTAFEYALPYLRFN
jgi:GTP-binding protein HflX